MKYKTKSYVVSQMIKDYEKEPGKNNRLVFDCPIQRPEGQWSNVAQSLLIHSILQEYLVPNICIVQNGADDFEPMTVLDGKQRMTIVYNYVANGFKLSKATPPVEVIVPEVDVQGNFVKDENGNTKTHIEYVEIKNKKFDKLSKEFQDKIKNFEFTATMITKATKRELEEQIYRLNNGKSPTATHKAFMKGGIDVAEAIRNRILGNNFFTNRFDMSAAQERGGEDMKCAFHVLALLTNADFNKLTSGDLTKIAEAMRTDWENGTLTDTNIEYCNNLLEDLNYWLPEEELFDYKKVLTTVHIPIMVMNVEKAKQMIDDEELTTQGYKEFLKYWVTEGFYKNEYCECSEGSPSDKRNIEKRINFMEKELYKFIGLINEDEDNTDIPVEIPSEFNSMENILNDIIDFEDEALFNVQATMLVSEMPVSDVSKFLSNYNNLSETEQCKLLENAESIMFDSYDYLDGISDEDSFLNENNLLCLIKTVSLAKKDDLPDSVIRTWLNEFIKNYHNNICFNGITEDMDGYLMGRVSYMHSDLIRFYNENIKEDI